MAILVSAKNEPKMFMCKLVFLLRFMVSFGFWIKNISLAGYEMYSVLMIIITMVAWKMWSFLWMQFVVCFCAPHSQGRNDFAVRYHVIRFNIYCITPCKLMIKLDQAIVRKHNHSIQYMALPSSINYHAKALINFENKLQTH